MANMSITIEILDSWVDHNIMEGYTGYVLCIIANKLRLLEKKL